MSRFSPILIYGHDALLLDTRRLVLETAGFKVATYSDLPIVLRALIQEAPGLLVLCHSLPPVERAAALAAAAAHQPPIETLSSRTAAHAAGEETISGDLLDDLPGPEGLIDAVRRSAGSS